MSASVSEVKTMSLQVLQGDCLEVMKTLADKSIDLFICDLPYGCLTGGGGKEKAKRGKGGTIGGCDWDVKIDLVAFWIQIKRLMKDDHVPIIHFCNTRFGNDLINSNPKWFRYDLIWNKSNAVGFLHANKMPMRSHELIYVFAKKGARYNRVDTKGDFKKAIGGAANASFLPLAGMPNTTKDNKGSRCVKSVIDAANKKIKGNHPTQKPDELYKWLIERYSKEGDTVLDPTAGSFASCFVASELKRKAIGIEMNQTYFKKAQDATRTADSSDSSETAP